MAEVTLREAQAEVDRYIRTVGVRYFSELSNLAQLMEEVGEVARIVVRDHGDQSWREGAERGEISEELADALAVLLALANQTGVDLTSAFQASMEKKRTRDAARHGENPKLG